MAEYVTTETTEVARPTRVVKTTKVNPEIHTEHPQKVYEKKKAIFRTYQVVWYILCVIEVLLFFRVVLKALGANPFSGFTNLIYTLSNPLALPFQGILPTPVTQGSVFEWSTIIGAIVYFLIAAGLVQLMQIIKPVTPDEVEQSV
ncbi:MAG TPA: YggT family protein [Patescibacteria group bacterium]|nr:YggT family protein [Patescibacteria group bacterium]